MLFLLILFNEKESRSFEKWRRHTNCYLIHCIQRETYLRWNKRQGVKSGESTPGFAITFVLGWVLNAHPPTQDKTGLEQTTLPRFVWGSETSTVTLRTDLTRLRIQKCCFLVGTTHSDSAMYLERLTHSFSPSMIQCVYSYNQMLLNQLGFFLEYII